MWSIRPLHIAYSCGTDNQTAVIRWDYGDPQLGTCKETIQGGAHFRYWVQDGDQANRFGTSLLTAEHMLTVYSGAIFAAASYELPIAREL